jgi:hypothetical protein
MFTKHQRTTGILCTGWGNLVKARENRGEPSEGVRENGHPQEVPKPGTTEESVSAD